MVALESDAPSAHQLQPLVLPCHVPVWLPDVHVPLIEGPLSVPCAVAPEGDVSEMDVPLSVPLNVADPPLPV